MTPIKWFLLAASLRLIAAWNNSYWHHPDEWFQTVELANLIVSGTASHTQEIALHMRNLTWPLLLSLPLKLASLISPEWIGLRVFLVSAFTGLLDLVLIWGFWVSFVSILKELKVTPKARSSWETVCFTILLFPWFTISESVRPSSEHVSAIAFWLSMGLLAKGRFGLAGLAIAAIGAFRYSAGLLGLGLVIGVLLRAVYLKRSYDVARVLGGLTIGIFVFGLPDWLFYGFPWKSLWMYLQFNIFSELGQDLYGTQSAIVYFEYFLGHWNRVVYGFGILLLAPAITGTAIGIRAFQPFAIALFCFLIPHLWIGHKEPRFMTPVEYLVVFTAMYSIAYQLRKGQSFWERTWKSIGKKPSRKRAMSIALVILCIPNFAWFLKSLWGESLRPLDTYFEINRHLRTVENACAIITVRRPITTTLPTTLPTSNSLSLKSFPRIPVAENFPSPSLAYLPSSRNTRSFLEMTGNELLWVNRGAKCKPSDRALFHVHKIGDLPAYGCRVLSSGLLKFLPRKYWEGANERNWVSGPWLDCPSQLIYEFNAQIYPLVAEEFPNFDIPKRMLTKQELIELTAKNSKGLVFGTEVLNR